MEKWKAVYNDGTKLEQYNDDGSANTYRDIDRERLACFSLSVFGKKFTVSLDDGRQLIYRKRIRQVVGGPKEEGYILGWKKDGVQSIMFITEDEVISAGKWGRGFFSAPKFFEFE